METSNKSTGTQSNDPMLFAEDTLASLSAKQANAKEKPTHDTYGHGYEKPLADYDPITQSWRMFGDTYLWGESPSLETLPASGMTRNGVLFQQPAWEPITGEIELSSWPTPVASDAWTAELKSTQQKPGSRHSVSLGNAVQMWPTPTTQEVEHPEATLTATGRRLSKNGKTSHSVGLADAVNLWPTMGANGMGNTGSRQMLDKKIKDGSITEDDKKAMSAGNGGKLNPTWVEWLMGFPTGWTDLED